MMNRTAKAAFYALASPLMRANGAFYKFALAPRNGVIKVHLGPGQRNYLPGWINIDANIFTAKCDVWFDLRYPLPLKDSSVTALYSHHVIEHLPNREAHFAEAFRSLKPGGIYRVGGPSGDGAIAKFVQGDVQWFSDWPDERRSIGGRLDNFIFCRGEHLMVLTFDYLAELLENAGFVDIIRRVPKDTGFPELFSDAIAKECETDFLTPHTLLVEARKPE